ncbi:MAG: hypothetical protein OEW44_07035, partial [Gemmatimonadota bacterium]|nr:hypothetical protein [Gemmatimonadota bacterium]
MSAITYRFDLDTSYTAYGNNAYNSTVLVGVGFPGSRFQIRQIRIHTDSIDYNWARTYVQIHHKNSPWFWHEGGFPYRDGGSDTGYTTFKQAGLTGAGTQYGGIFFVNGVPVRVPRVVNQAYGDAYSFASGSLWGHVGFQANNATGAISTVVGATYDGYASYRHSYGASWLLEADPGHTLLYTVHDRGIWTANTSLALPSSSLAGAPGQMAYRDFGTHAVDDYSTGRDTLPAYGSTDWVARPNLYNASDGQTEDAIAVSGYLEGGQTVTDDTWLATEDRSYDWMCCG